MWGLHPVVIVWGFYQIRGNPAGGRDWKNPRVFQDVTEDVRTLLHWLRNLRDLSGQGESCQGSWLDG